MEPDFKINPIAKIIYDTYHKSIKDDLEYSYFKEFGHADKWMCVSDYAFDKKKSNNVITFSLFPYVMDMFSLSQLIKMLSPKEIKNTSKTNFNFVDFIKISPFLTFSFIVNDYENLFYETREAMIENYISTFEGLYKSVSTIKCNSIEIKEYYDNAIVKINKVINCLKENKKIRIIERLLLVTSIGSILSAQVANRTNSKIFSWFSDRDSINDVADNISNELFHLLFSEHLIDNDCVFVAAPSSSKDEEWYGEMVKIPDFITGVLADYNINTKWVSHKKFEYPIKELLADNNRNVFMMKLDFKAGDILNCSRIVLKKIV
ncbi:MAG: hypothetical protein GC192_20430 [Bacteroidetes bacterium]|nr:hypothetical protein [Bacteroidota bacterium]